MKLRRGLAAGAGICSAVAMGIALESGHPASAIGPPADGTYTFNEAGVSGVSWTISALCDQPSGTRNMNDYSDPIVFAMNCALNVVSSTPEQISAADKLQNFGGRARMSSMLWTFKVDKADGVSCPVAAKLVNRLGIVFGRLRPRVGRIILTQKNFTVSMNSISLSEPLICPGQRCF